ncbi:uncharacterized protein ACLA_084010 [Aspergillus clavatus NRRL 1]|uniref:Transglutaminase-like domain-containing protein n=1 Tax=Aspergillus clavatus (strain ATCC 1007 / CBS 513.65 / DSM 816 / NCTC 3887 / NRRL 1 / QM 1276 / 107) TaxID=344612 RepID=A1CTR9_ASPCL|nr:uncharacterized protein ACLA_084010 [Aspergillus clavatus NRRL 1]EAW06706.1 hypothetical protein ACLA_084010 [Aspergillus clavatus NRRL 1]
MAEETQVLSIQQRIAALKQAQAGESVDGSGSAIVGSHPTPFTSRPASFRASTINNPPTNGYGSVVERSTIGNEPAGAPTPVPRSQSFGQKPKAPPPLPTRKASYQQLAPALPPRRPSVNSIDSAASDTSRSTISTSTVRTTETCTSNGTGNGRTVRAPRYDEAKLPPLPPKRGDAKGPKTPQRPKSATMKSGDSLPPPLPSIREPPSLPSSRPALPIRRAVSNISLRSTESMPRLPPRLPSRDGQDRSPGADTEVKPARKLPPPLPSGAALGKLQQSGFGDMNKKAHSTEVPNGAPPPVPVASKPDLSKLMATKPRMSNGNFSVPSTTGCLKCRDFSGPDAHAAKFPRETLPTHDLVWLARELTTPFPSATDKARALFTWCHHNICYNVEAFFNNCVRPSTPASTLATGLAVCEGYAAIFAALATHAGLEALVISGHGKGYGYEPLAPGASVPPYNAGHAWNAVRIDNGQWKLIDACWGAGVVQGPGQPYQKLFNPSLFTMTNDEFGLKHFPGTRDHFFRDNGRPGPSWEEYILSDPQIPFGVEQPKTWGDIQKHYIGERTFLPAAKRISPYQQVPVRFQFSLICEHFSLEWHAKIQPSVFLLIIHGVDGRKDEYIAFDHVRGTEPGGGGDLWYLDVQDPRTLGAPGQKLLIAVLTKFEGREDARGVTVQEYRQKAGRVAMSFAYIAEWELV